MSGLKLQLCIALAALSLPAAAQSQVCRACTVEQVDIPLKDGAGNTRAIMRFHNGEPGKRVISFIDVVDYKVINTITEPPPPPTVVSGENPLRGDPLPELVDLAGKYDDAEYLTRQVEELKKQVKLLTQRMNAAAAK